MLGGLSFVQTRGTRGTRVDTHCPAPSEGEEGQKKTQKLGLGPENESMRSRRFLKHSGEWGRVYEAGREFWRGEGLNHFRHKRMANWALIDNSKYDGFKISR